MKLISKIKAFFRRNEETVELDLAAAEIREGKAFLHTKGDNPMTYFVRANDIEIRLNKDAVINDVDILTVKKPSKDDEQREKQKEKEIQKANKKKVSSITPKEESSTAQSAEFLDLERFKKRKFVISVYPEEYDLLMSSIKEYGYKRADFVLACVNTATKGTMERAHKKIVKSHRELLLEQQAMLATQIQDLEKNGSQTG